MLGFPGGASGKEPTCQRRRQMCIQSLGQEDPLEEGNPLQYSCLENPLTEEPGGLLSIGSQRVGHN